jgi:aminoglycoside/choline kinase family phosphotransferase
MTEPVQIVEALFKKWKNTDPLSIVPLPESGSYRTYYRIFYNEGSVLGVHNKDEKENKAFIYLQNQLKENGIRVPEVLYTGLENNAYLEQDLGDTTLFDHLALLRKNVCDDDTIKEIYKKVIDAMPALQVDSARGMDYSYCYPRSEFDTQSMMWDMNYFKYCLLKPLKISFFEQDLEDDFNKIAEWLIAAPRNSFMFRDFQSRNIMLHDQLYFIDFQGGRKGPLQYDLASLLFEAKTHLSEAIRNELLSYYLKVFKANFDWFNAEEFLNFYYGFVYLRLMQAMGAYGFRGYIEHKPVFLQSLPFALNTLKWLMEKQPLPLNLKSLPGVFERLINLPQAKTRPVNEDAFTVTINSFSYKNGIPQDHSGNGGGFVFDCRYIDNPGRYAEYKTLTGRDKPVIDFLKDREDVKDFMNNAFSLVTKAVDVYTNRGFSHLMVSFGCTGGQHRSVYMAEQLLGYLSQNKKVNVVLIHHELAKKEQQL